MEGGLPPDYVMDRMQPYEIEIALEGLHLKHKELWEATRMVMYTIAQVNSRSTIDPKELLRLPWDEGADMEDSADHYEEMKKEMSNMLKQMNNASGFSDQALAEESGV